MDFIKQDYSQTYYKISKKHGCFLTKHSLRNTNQLRMIQGRTGNSSASPGGTESIVRNIYSYQVPAMVGTNASTKEKHNLYNSTVQAISRGGGDSSTKVISLCARVFYMGTPVKTQAENGPSKLFDLRGQTLDTSDQEIFILKDSGLHDEAGK